MGIIVEIQLKSLQKILATRNITIELTDKAKKYLAEKGFDPVYGARPLKRVIQKELQDQLAEEILAGKIADGSNLKVDKKADGLSFT